MKHLIPEFEKLRARFPAGFESSLVLPCLRRIQEDRGYVANSDIEELAVFLGVPQIQIEEVLSFYTQFRRKPIGRWHLQFCHNVSCSMNGAAPDSSVPGVSNQPSCGKAITCTSTDAGSVACSRGSKALTRSTVLRWCM